MAFEWVSYFWGSDCDELSTPSCLQQPEESENWFWVDLLPMDSEEKGFIVVGKTLPEGGETENRKPSYADVLKRDSKISNPFAETFHDKVKKLETALVFPRKPRSIPAHGNGDDNEKGKLTSTQTTLSYGQIKPLLAIEWHPTTQPIPRMLIPPRNIRNIAAKMPVLSRNIKNTSHFISDSNRPTTNASHLNNIVAITPEMFASCVVSNYYTTTHRVTKRERYPELNLRQLLCHSHISNKRFFIDQNDEIQKLCKNSKRSWSSKAPFYTETQPLCISWHEERKQEAIITKRMRMSLQDVIGKYIGKLMTVAMYLASQYILTDNDSQDFEEEISTTAPRRKKTKIARVQSDKQLEKQFRNAQQMAAKKDKKKPIVTKQPKHRRCKRSKGRLQPRNFSGCGGIRAC